MIFLWNVLHCIYLQRIRIDTFNALLHDMIAVLIFDTLQNMSIQFPYYFLLLFRRNRLQSLLYHPATIHLKSKGKHMSSNLLGQSCLLLWSAELEEFLYNIVSEDIRHEIVCSRQDFIENHLFFCCCGPFQFLLDESGAVLILGKFHNVVGQIPETKYNKNFRHMTMFSVILTKHCRMVSEFHSYY